MRLRTPRGPWQGEREDSRRGEGVEEVGWRAELGEEGWFVTFNLHWSPMALTRGPARDIAHKHTGKDACNCCTWMNTHTLVQGRCHTTYGPCHSTQTLSVRSLIGSERTIWQWTVTPLIRGDIAALSGQPGSHYCHRPYHKFRVIVFC